MFSSDIFFLYFVNYGLCNKNSSDLFLYYYFSNHFVKNFFLMFIFIPKEITIKLKFISKIDLNLAPNVPHFSFFPLFQVFLSLSSVFFIPYSLFLHFLFFLLSPFSFASLFYLYFSIYFHIYFSFSFPCFHFHFFFIIFI